MKYRHSTIHMKAKKDPVWPRYPKRFLRASLSCMKISSNSSVKHKPSKVLDTEASLSLSTWEPWLKNCISLQNKTGAPRPILDIKLSIMLFRLSLNIWIESKFKTSALQIIWYKWFEKLVIGSRQSKHWKEHSKLKTTFCFVMLSIPLDIRFNEHSKHSACTISVAVVSFFLSVVWRAVGPIAAHGAGVLEMGGGDKLG